MIDQADDILDDLFHGCAFAAWLDQAAAERGWPGSEATRQRAFRYYEEALAAKRAGGLPASGSALTSPDACPISKVSRQTSGEAS